MPAADERRLAFLSNVRHDVPLPNGLFTISKCISFIETTVLRPTDPAAGLEHDGVERRSEEPFVVQIRRAQDDAHGNAAAVG
jgi:hypothetical protein